MFLDLIGLFHVTPQAWGMEARIRLLRAAAGAHLLTSIPKLKLENVASSIIIVESGITRLLPSTITSSLHSMVLHKLELYRIHLSVDLVCFPELLTLALPNLDDEAWLPASVAFRR